MTPRRRFRLAFLARLVVALLMAVFAFPTLGEACCGLAAASAAAKADDCCPSSTPVEDDDESHDSSPCSCPLSCTSGCTGLGRALAVGTGWEVLPPASASIPREFGLVADPLTPDPRDILRVPKRVAA